METDYYAIQKKSEERLLALGAEINHNLPFIDSFEEVTPRSAQDAAGRACAIVYVIGLGFGAPREVLKECLSRYSLDRWVSGHERELLDSPELSEQEKINCTWLPDCVQALAWALGLAELDCRRHCDDDLSEKFPFKRDPADFIAAATLRPIAEIQAEVDFHYRLHWWTRQCRLRKVKCPFSNSIVMERRRALDWLYGTAEAWDDVSLDT